MRLDRELPGEQAIRGFEQVHGGEHGASSALRRKSKRVSLLHRVHRRTSRSAGPEPGGARRRRVLDATLALAADGGFDAVQMRDVAAAADVALGTVYRYFSSKERLLLEAMAEQQADLRVVPRTRIRPPSRRPADRVLAVLARSNRSLRRYPDVTAAMVRAFGSAAVENADIVRKVTEIMTDDHHRRDPGRRAARRDRPRAAHRAHPHAGLAVVVERLGVRRRRARAGRRRPGRRRAPLALLSPPAFLSSLGDHDPTLQLRRPLRARGRHGARSRRGGRSPPARHLRRARSAREPTRAHAPARGRASRASTSGSSRRTASSGSRRCSRSTRSAPASVNVNFRYVEEELRYLFDNSDMVALVYQREYGPLIAAARDAQPKLADVRPRRVGRLRRRRLRARADRVRGRARRRTRPSATSASAPTTTSTCSTRAAPPACPRA